MDRILQGRIGYAKRVVTLSLRIIRFNCVMTNMGRSGQKLRKLLNQIYTVSLKIRSPILGFNAFFVTKSTFTPSRSER
jgi:hypothetical protein